MKTNEQDTNNPDLQRCYEPLVGMEFPEIAHGILNQPVVWGRHWAVEHACSTLPGYRNLPKNTRRNIRRKLEGLKSAADVLRFNANRKLLNN